LPAAGTAWAHRRLCMLSAMSTHFGDFSSL
jgi:hypothetical protein